MTRREFAALAAGTLVARAAPGAPVSIARAQSYNDDLAAVLAGIFDQLGGLDRIVRGKTVTVKLNLTGSPALKFEGRPLGLTHYTHPKLAGAFAHLCGQAGARRIRFVEGCAATGGPMEEYLLDSGWNVRSLVAAAPGVEFENTNNLGKGKEYARMKVPGKAYMYPAYDLNHSYRDTDVFVSFAKLKNHETCGVTLSLKNIFGITPSSIYGDDSGAQEPNEKSTQGRADTLHFAKRTISKSAPQELNAEPSRDAGYRVPRIVADLAAARPIDLAIIDGIETVAGGEGPWVSGLRAVKPGLLIAGTNPVATDAVAMACMGYDPRATRGTAPFLHSDNTLRLAEDLGVGTTDINRIDVRGLHVKDAVFRFRS
ncbi:MAG TPA: DUF362 domain-containing protein [Bryobacteraceae bacterium]|nr:DUF362 domain-containing protein [Bryobacteraceae bacterium]